MFRNTPLLPYNFIKLGSKTLLCHFGIRSQEQPYGHLPKNRKTLKFYRKCRAKTCETKTTTRLMEFLHFLNITGNGNNLGKFSGHFCLTARWKNNWPQRNLFYSFFPAQFFELSFNRRCKVKWPPRHLDRVFFEKVFHVFFFFSFLLNLHFLGFLPQILITSYCNM